MAYTLTEEEIKDAKSYVPVCLKTQLVQEIAPLCIDRVRVNVTKDGDAERPSTTSMPDMFKENALVRSLFLRGVLAHYYLKREVGGKKCETVADLRMPADEYDKYGNICNQLERMKGTSAVRDKVFDILSDYRDFEKRLNSEIYFLANCKNDVCTRIMAMIEMQSTPEALQNSVSDINALREQLTAVMQNRKPDTEANANAAD